MNAKQWLKHPHHLHQTSTNAVSNKASSKTFMLLAHSAVVWPCCFGLCEPLHPVQQGKGQPAAGNIPPVGPTPSKHQDSLEICGRSLLVAGVCFVTDKQLKAEHESQCGVKNINPLCWWCTLCHANCGHGGPRPCHQLPPPDTRSGVLFWPSVRAPWQQSSHPAYHLPPTTEGSWSDHCPLGIFLFFQWIVSKQGAEALQFV